MLNSRTIRIVYEHWLPRQSASDVNYVPSVNLPEKLAPVVGGTVILIYYAQS